MIGRVARAKRPRPFGKTISLRGFFETLPADKRD